ncbi:MAG TPA: ROK family protein, partial [Candidatus Saccharimonadales bacterium]|nr:ROK family protein [Candidatus Saccharimonadales bacterium]
MYLGIDIGATKTLLATFTNKGDIKERIKFLTPKNYAKFKIELSDNVAKLSTNTFTGCCVGVPGRLDRKQGIGIA